MTMPRSILLMLLLTVPACWADTPTRSALDEARELYSEALIEISKGHRHHAKRIAEELEDYPLYPYLELELLKAKGNRLKQSELDDFLAKYPDSVVAQRLRINWLHRQIRQGDWKQFLVYYRQKPPGGMSCEFIRALRAERLHSEADAATAKLWLSPSSLPKECDPLLRQWLARISEEEHRAVHWQRARLAMKADQSSLARYLLSKVPGTEAYRDLIHRPQRLYSQGLKLPVNEYSRDVAVYALERLAAQDFDRANGFWHQLDQHLAFTPEQNYHLRDQLARQIIAADTDYVREWLLAVDPTFEDPYLTEWQVRLALKDGDWNAVQRFINVLPEKRRVTAEWQYWWLRADIALRGEMNDVHRQAIAAIANDRGYYSFLAAELIDQNYRLDARRNVDLSRVDEVARQPAVRRARELLLLGDINTARQEWAAGMATLDQNQRIAAAQLALDWDWSNQAIVTAIRAGEWDDLTLRFPLAYRQAFTDTAKKYDLDLKWIYGISRQESAFAPDARSPVGARGLMQLMPGTARVIARQTGRPQPGSDELTDPDTNIAMGGYYLGQLLEQFGGNRILATAAYNAGPNRVERVLMRQQGSIPADIWIENLPYGETREYIKNVLAFSVIYGEKLDLKRPMLDQQERHIAPRTTTASAN